MSCLSATPNQIKICSTTKFKINTPFLISENQIKWQVLRFMKYHTWLSRYLWYLIKWILKYSCNDS